MTENIVFQTKDLHKSYGRTLAINGISLNVQKGQIYGLLGPNGSGKTTTLSIATGILSQDSGTCQWFNSRFNHKSRKKIGSLIESPHFYPYLTLIQNLEIIAKIKSEGLHDIERVLKLVKLYDRKNSKFKTLSLGMKQRLGIASTLLGNPEVLVLDEPTNGLDPEGIAEVRDLIINEAQKGKTIIMASHILNEVEKVCSHVAILKKGVVIAQGEVKSIIGGESLLEVASEDLVKLKKELESCKFITSVKQETESYMIMLEKDKTPTDLNSYLFEKSIVLSRLINHKKSLETQFLELIKEEK